MLRKLFAEATRIAAGDDRTRYDALEIAFHWATAILVVLNYLLAQAWGLLARGAPLRHGMQSLHVSLGLVLTSLIAARILWRIGPGRRVAPAYEGFVELASKAMHYGLYALLTAVAALGFCFRWAQHEPLGFFGLFALPSPYPFAKEQARAIGEIHQWAANVLLIIAGLHAAAALFHHFVLRDDVLWRMLPGAWARRREAAAPDARAVAEKLDERS